MENEKVLPIGETAKLLGVSIQTLRRWDEKGVLKSFRANPRGNRFYRKEDLDLFMNDLPALGWKWASETIPSEPPNDFYCATSDVFTVRLERLKNDLQKIKDLGVHYSILALITGEIGDNSYAHNLGNWPDILGIFFAYDLNRRVIVLADRGRGILETLKFIRPDLPSHNEALKVAFTEIISGRFSEQRGNGLKSVARNVVANNISLLYRTGNAQLDLCGDGELKISNSYNFHGCYAVLKF